MSRTLRHGGVIDRLTADGFTAYWNAPLDDAEHALHACEAGNDMMAALAEVNKEIAAARRLGDQAMPVVEIGIGIATGPVIAGGFAGHGRLSYSVNGDAVRQAVRLQALSRNYGSTAIVGEETQQKAARGFAFLEVDYVAQNREDRPVRLYAMLDNPVARASPKIRAPGHLSRTHLPVAAQPAMGEGQGLGPAMPQPFGRLPDALRSLSGAHPLFRIQPAGPGWDGAFRPVLK